MKILEVIDRTPILIDKILEVWEDSVRATHSFLKREEIENIKKYVPQALKETEHLIIIENKDNVPIAFMGTENKKIEMLFIKNSERGKGLGKKLVNYSIEKYNINEVVVNEQNPNAKAFYEHLGFIVYKRSENDEQGNSYPILYMKLVKEDLKQVIDEELIEFNSLIPELSVSNIDISKSFYMDLGFQIKYERKENKFCFLQLEKNQIMLEEQNNNWNTGKLEHPYGRGFNISMTISDIEKMYNELKEKGIKFFLDLEVHEYKVNDKNFWDKEFLIQDPDGYLLRFNN